MIAHYLKVAFRNLWKYKTQHLIALAGVGVALLCFSICLYVVRYAFSRIIVLQTMNGLPNSIFVT